MLLPFMVRLGAVVVSRCDVCFLSNSHFSYEWFTYVTNAAQVNPIWEKTSIFSAIIRQKVFIQGDWGEHERGEMQKTAFTNFTGQWRLNTWWIHIERSYSTGNCTPQIQKIMQFKWQRQQFLLLRNGKKTRNEDRENCSVWEKIRGSVNRATFEVLLFKLLCSHSGSSLEKWNFPSCQGEDCFVCTGKSNRRTINEIGRKNMRK